MWSDWADFTRTRIESKGSVEDVPAYAVRAPNGGVNVMLANHSEGKVEVRLGIKLGRGIFSVARHAFEVESETKHPKTEQLQSVLLKAPGMLSKPVWLMPKSATVVCITDETRSLDRALDEARNALRGVAGSAPRTFRLIRSPLGESAQRIEQIAAQGGAMGRSKLTMRAEQAAMSLSHAQSVFRNARSSGILTGDAADDIGTAFDRLETSISTTAAAGLGLVVSAEWGELPAGDGEAVETPVTVQVSNRGDRSLRSVKLGISAPKGCRISPEEMAVFRAVRPAESVRAEFQVKTDSKKSLKAVRADISYIAGRAPILLRTKIY